MTKQTLSETAAKVAVQYARRELGRKVEATRVVLRETEALVLLTPLPDDPGTGYGDDGPFAMLLMYMTPTYGESLTMTGGTWEVTEDSVDVEQFEDATRFEPPAESNCYSCGRTPAQQKRPHVCVECGSWGRPAQVRK